MFIVNHTNKNTERNTMKDEREACDKKLAEMEAEICQYLTSLYLQCNIQEPGEFELRMKFGFYWFRGESDIDAVNEKMKDVIRESFSETFPIPLLPECFENGVCVYYVVPADKHGYTPHIIGEFTVEGTVTPPTHGSPPHIC